MIKQISQFEEKPISFDEFIKNLMEKDVIFFGEDHSDHMAYDNQLILLKKLIAMNDACTEDVVQVGLEDFFEDRDGHKLDTLNNGDWSAVNLLSEGKNGYFEYYTKPFMRVCYDLSIKVNPIGDKTMRSGGILKVLHWNKGLAANISQIANKGIITIPIVGKRHLTRITYEYASTPEFLIEKKPELSIAVIHQIKPEQKTDYFYPSPVPTKPFIEQYSIYGRLK